VELKSEDYGVIHIKLNQLVYENAYTITSLPIKVFKRYYSNQHFPEFYPQDGGENQLA